MKRRLSDFDMEKDEWYYQEKVYINPRSADSLYNELKEFRQSLTKEIEDGLITGNLNEILTMDEPEENVKKLKAPEKIEAPEGIENRPEAFNSRGFFDEKLKILKDEIEDINRNLEEREKIEKISSDSIDEEIEEVKRQLHEIYTWKKGEKSTIEFIRMEFLKQLASLNREKRQSSLGFWKDRVFEKRDRRNMILEYKSLDWMGTLTQEKFKERK